MGTNYPVRYKTYEMVADIAEKARKQLGISNCCSFDIVKQIERLKGREFGELGLLQLDLFDHDGDPAEVTFDPLTLHIHKEVWDDAKLGEPKSRFILAHELGHILMHGHSRQAFSEDAKESVRFVEDEERTETQANWFADAFLAPNFMISRGASDIEICQNFSYPIEYIWLKRKVLQRKSARLPSDICTFCGAFAVVGSWSERKCKECGSSAVRF